MTNNNLAAGHAAGTVPGSPFTGVDVCELAGLALTPGSIRPIFDQDVWVLDGLADAHRMMGAVEKRWDFTTIPNPAWRLVAKELMLALLAPGHERVAQLSHAHRNRLSPRTCRKHLRTLIMWLAWLQARHIRSLAEVTQIHCDEFLRDAFVKRDVRGNQTTSSNTAGSVAARVWVVQLLAIYGELFTADRYRPGFAPWNGKPANTVTGHQRSGENKTPPVPLPVLRPLLAACLYLIDTIGPHTVNLHKEFRPAQEGGSAPPHLLSDRLLARLSTYLHDLLEQGQPLLRLPDQVIAQRLESGWSADDPILPVNTNPLGRQVGRARLHLRHINQFRPLLEQVIQTVGIEHQWGRNATPVAGADDGGPRPWTLPMSYLDIRGLTTAVTTACIIVTAAASGMRTSELLELNVGCRLPPTTRIPPPHGGSPRDRRHPGPSRTPNCQAEDGEHHPARAHPGARSRDRRTCEVQRPCAVTARRAATGDPPTSSEHRLARQRPKAPRRQEVEDHRTMQLNEYAVRSSEPGRALSQSAATAVARLSRKLGSIDEA